MAHRIENRPRKEEGIIVFPRTRTSRVPRKLYLAFFSVYEYVYVVSSYGEAYHRGLRRSSDLGRSKT
jgi:hypothetical protein